jgi:hypothetical protein
MRQNRDDFYGGPPLEDPEHWHDGAVVDAGPVDRTAAAAPNDALNVPLVDVDTPERAGYPLRNRVERPYRAESGLPQGQLTRDTSLSRAVDRAASDAPVLEAGYDRSIEGEPPGPLAPDVNAPPDTGSAEGDEQLPAGQWGSSGSRP